MNWSKLTDKRRQNNFILVLFYGLICFVFLLLFIFHEDFRKVYTTVYDEQTQPVETQLAYPFTDFESIAENCGVEKKRGKYWLSTGKRTFDCLHWLGKNQQYDSLYPSKGIHFHTYINEIDRNNVEPPFYAVLLSFLLTQRRDSTLWIWTQVINDNKRLKQRNMNYTYLMPESDQIQIKVPDDKNLFNHLEHKKEMKDLFMERNKTTENRLKEIYFSDLARIAILKVHGGVYFDFDTILLRPFDLLINYEFTYRFGAAGMSNNAISYFKKDSILVKKILIHAWDGSKYNPKKVGPGSYERVLANYLLNPNTNHTKNVTLPIFIIYPAIYFDAHWIALDKRLPKGTNLTPKFVGFDGILKSNNSCSFPEDDIFSNFFHGSFAYHCHCLKPGIHYMQEDSCLHRLLKALQKKWQSRNRFA